MAQTIGMTHKDKIIEEREDEMHEMIFKDDIEWIDSDWSGDSIQLQALGTVSESIEEILSFADKNASRTEDGDGLTQYECEFCEYMTENKAFMEKHRHNHHTGEKPFNCERCGRGFNKGCNLKLHMRTHANEFAFQCAICRQGFDFEEEKKSHEKICDCKVYQCDLCKYQTLYKSSYNRHMVIHTGAKKIGCFRCSKTFTLKGNLIKHMKQFHGKSERDNEHTITGGKQLRNEANEMISSNGNQSFRANSIGQNDARAACESSNKDQVQEINARELLNENTASSTEDVTDCPPASVGNEKIPEQLISVEEMIIAPDDIKIEPIDESDTVDGSSLPIDTAGAPIIARNEIEWYDWNEDTDQNSIKPRTLGIVSKSIEKIPHSEEQHFICAEKEDGTTRYKCEFCGYSTRERNGLTKHRRIHTGEKPFKCKKCARRFTVASSLKKHMRTHANEFAFNCSICRQGFDSEEAKMSHEKTCNCKILRCDSCDYQTLYKSSFDRHVRTHTGERPFGCSQCLKSFRETGNLVKHMKHCTGNTENANTRKITGSNQRASRSSNRKRLRKDARNSGDMGMDIDLNISNSMDCETRMSFGEPELNTCMNETIASNGKRSNQAKAQNANRRELLDGDTSSSTVDVMDDGLLSGDEMSLDQLIFGIKIDPIHESNTVSGAVLPPGIDNIKVEPIEDMNDLVPMCFDRFMVAEDSFSDESTEQSEDEMNFKDEIDLFDDNWKGDRSSIQLRALETVRWTQYKCDLCEYETKFKSDMTRHGRIHTGAKPFKCKNCAKGFSRKSSLKVHMRMHAMEFAFQCAICRQGFDSEEAKSSHERTCNCTRYECDICKYQTFKKSHIHVHMRKHTGEKPFDCRDCSKSFTQKGALIVHMKQFHDKSEKSQKRKMFKSSSDLKSVDCETLAEPSFSNTSDGSETIPLIGQNYANEGNKASCEDQAQEVNMSEFLNENTTSTIEDTIDDGFSGDEISPEQLIFGIKIEPIDEPTTANGPALSTVTDNIKVEPVEDIDRLYECNAEPPQITTYSCVQNKPSNEVSTDGETGEVMAETSFTFHSMISIEQSEGDVIVKDEIELFDCNEYGGPSSIQPQNCNRAETVEVNNEKDDIDKSQICTSENNQKAPISLAELMRKINECSVLLERCDNMLTKDQLNQMRIEATSRVQTKTKAKEQSEMDQHNRRFMDIAANVESSEDARDLAFLTRSIWLDHSYAERTVNAHELFYDEGMSQQEPRTQRTFYGHRRGKPFIDWSTINKIGNAREEHRNKMRSIVRTMSIPIQAKAVVKNRSKLLKCDLCEFVTKIKTNLETHRRIHTGEKPFKCEKCAKEFNQASNFKRHMSMHANQFALNCSICRQKFHSKEAKNAHEKRCDFKGYQCDLCEYHTIKKSHFNVHMRSHGRERPFDCLHCSRKFTQKNHVMNHMRFCNYVASTLDVDSTESCANVFREDGGIQSQSLSHNTSKIVTNRTQFSQEH